MSTARQAIAARRKARTDPRYKGQKFGDAAVSGLRLEAKIRREYERDRRKAKAKK